jgi:hypothetical protein
MSKYLDIEMKTVVNNSNVEKIKKEIPAEIIIWADTKKLKEALKDVSKFSFSHGDCEINVVSYLFGKCNICGLKVEEIKQAIEEKIKKELERR